MPWRRHRVSIRCRARRTAELHQPAARPVRRRFYSLSCETYSGTGSTGSHQKSRRVSIRCRARRTAEPQGLYTIKTKCGNCGFYSLSCETYSGTFGVNYLINVVCVFLFAVVRDVQRNQTAITAVAKGYAPFLFAVVRDVQRNLKHLLPCA